MVASISTVSTQIALSITVAQFASFATPAITVPFPSVYGQTQIPFTYAATATFAATRIPTIIGGIAATAGISTADAASGTTYGQSGSTASSKSSWPTWATGVIAGLGGAAAIVLAVGIFFLCTRGSRRRKRNAKKGIPAGAKRRKGSKVYTEKHPGGGAAKLHRASGAPTLVGDALPPSKAGSRPGSNAGSRKSMRPPSSSTAGGGGRGSVPYPPYPMPTAARNNALPHSSPAYPSQSYANGGTPAGSRYDFNDDDPNDGYATPPEFDGASGYHDSPPSARYDSPARLWEGPAADGTPRSSLHNSVVPARELAMGPPLVPIARQAAEGTTLLPGWRHSSASHHPLPEGATGSGSDESPGSSPILGRMRSQEQRPMSEQVYYRPARSQERRGGSQEPLGVAGAGAAGRRRPLFPDRDREEEGRAAAPFEDVGLRDDDAGGAGRPESELGYLEFGPRDGGREGAF